MPEKKTLVIKALEDTFLKKDKTRMASELSDKEKHFVPKGSEYRIVWKSGKSGNHVKVSLDFQAGNWYVFLPHWEGLEDLPDVPTPAPQVPGGVEVFKTDLKVLNLSQPDSSTCQAACIGMAVNNPDIKAIRRRLLQFGNAGSPTIMGRVINEYPVDYSLHLKASMNDIYAWLKQGNFLITHGWFTGSGHVICLDGKKSFPDSDKKLIDVKDPWSEFDGPSWSYNNPSIKFYDGYYSDRIIYAACVESASVPGARKIYNSGRMNTSLAAAWVHRFQ